MNKTVLDVLDIVGFKLYDIVYMKADEEQSARMIVNAYIDLYEGLVLVIKNAEVSINVLPEEITKEKSYGDIKQN